MTGLLACLCLGGLALTGSLALLPRGQPVSQEPASPRPAQQTTPVVTPQVMRSTPDSPEYQTLEILQQANIPLADSLDLARRLKGAPAIDATLPAPQAPFNVGDRMAFWVTDTENNERRQVWATLSTIGVHVYFWVADGISYDETDVRRLVEVFDGKIYPTDRQYFGSEWNPGVDGDPRLYILYARGLGPEIAGYFSSVDELPPQVHEYSNGHELFEINADTTSLSKDYIYGTMAHEFQHMIHWYQDRNEEGWLSEGLSMLAQLINGYEIGGFDRVFIQNPDVQLNDWAPRPQRNAAHYGASFLFLAYFLDRFGQSAIHSLVANPLNGLDSIDDVLAKSGAVDSRTGRIPTADDVFSDWVVTNYLLDVSVGDGRYQYRDYPAALKASATTTLSRCPAALQDQKVHQYAVNYIRITCPGSFTLKFTGSTTVGVVPINAHSGEYAFWSNKGDESDMTLTRAFDFSQVQGPLTFTYSTWYDLEKDYDYVYLEASSDGQSWKILNPPTCTSEDPTGNNWGCGYNGQSAGWVKESVDLSQYAGRQVWLRFEYVTDAMINGEGLLLDDFSIPQVGYSSDFELDDGGWQGKGFVRIRNRLPQTFRLSIILKGSTTTVLPVELAPNQTASIPLAIGGEVKEAVLVVSGTARFTRQTALYQFSLQPN